MKKKTPRPEPKINRKEISGRPVTDDHEDLLDLVWRKVKENPYLSLGIVILVAIILAQFYGC